MNPKSLNRIIIFSIAITAIIYFAPIWKNGLVPFPGNLLVSFFSPWKEELWSGYPTGVPRKGLLGFDTARMMGPWRSFITNELKQGRLPTWNPHQFAGAPLLANFQSALFFPPNLIYLLLPFSISWTILVISQPILATIGMYLLLKNLFHRPSSIVHRPLATIFPSLAYGFSGWMSAWIEWNIHGFVYALLPFALLSIIKQKTLITLITLIILIFSGHPQMAVIGITALAIAALVWKRLIWFTKILALAVLATAIQWLPSVKYYLQASRETSSSEFVYDKTLMPWPQISQLIAPNYLGNPATGNFSGIADFVETTAYSGIAILGFAMISVIEYIFGLSFLSLRGSLPRAKSRGGNLEDRHDFHGDPTMTIKYPLFLLLLIFILSFPNPISLLVGKFNLPILSTSVASRWLMLWPLGISILAAAGIDRFLVPTTSNHTKKARPFRERPGLFFPAVVISILIGGLWAAAFFAPPLYRSISIRNLVIPSVIAGLLLFIFFLKQIASSKNNYSLQVADRQSVMKILLFSLVVLSIGELILFGWKTMPYTEKRFIYPKTPVLEKLQELSRDASRFASTEGSVIESNFATYYGLYDLSGYDALYPRRMGELVWAAANDGQPVGDFSRSTVVMPTRPSLARDNLWNLAGVRWIIHKDDLLFDHPGQNFSLFPPDKFKLVWESGKWQIYENLKAFPRAFFIESRDWIGEGNEIIRRSLNSPNSPILSITPSRILSYQPTKVEIEINAPTNGFLVLTDTFYPGWKATVDGSQTEILPAFHAFRAVRVLQEGSHIIEFNYVSL